MAHEERTLRFTCSFPLLIALRLRKLFCLLLVSFSHLIQPVPFSYSIESLHSGPLQGLSIEFPVSVEIVLTSFDFVTSAEQELSVKVS